MKRVFEHPTVSTVVGGLVLAFLLWSGVFPTAWLWIKSTASYTLDILVISFEVPLWLAAIVSIPLLNWLIKAVYSWFSPVVELEPTLDAKVTQLAEEELGLFVSKDGQPLDYDDFKYSNLRMKKLQASQVLESLQVRGFVTIESNFYGTEFFLTKLGRDFVLGNKYTS